MEKNDESDIYKRFIERRIARARADGRDGVATGLEEALKLLTENRMMVEITHDELDASMSDMLTEAFAMGVPNLKKLISAVLRETPVAELDKALSEALVNAFVDASGGVKDRMMKLVLATSPPGPRGGGEEGGSASILRQEFICTAERLNVVERKLVAIQNILAEPEPRTQISEPRPQTIEEARSRGVDMTGDRVVEGACDLCGGPKYWCMEKCRVYEKP